jgi:hypothetical protein
MMKKAVLLLTMILTSFLTQMLTVNPTKSFVSAALSDETKKPLVMVIINSSIYAAIKSSVNQYEADLENEGFSVNTTETNQLSDKTPQGVRAYLQEALNHDLAGALFVGDVSEAWYEVDDTKFPTDMYYMDLNGSWKDLNGNGIYDEHSGDISPEIWVGRLKASTIDSDEASLINNYFTKNHRYRNGLRLLPWWRTLAYIDDDGVAWAEDVKLSLSQISTDITLVTDPATTNTSDYLRRLSDGFGYQWVYLMSHGSFDYHTFMISREQEQPQWDRSIYSWQYRSMDPRVFFYLFFVCSAARYTEPQYLAGSAVFAKTYGLLAIGSTDIMYSVSFRRFFTSLSEDKCIGTAFRDWFLEQSRQYNQSQEKQDYQKTFYGLTIVGDPTLQSYPRQNVLLHDISVTDVTVHLKNTTNERSLSIITTIENEGNFTETFDFTIRAGAILLTINTLSLSPKASRTVTFTVTQPYRVEFVSGNLKTLIEATASIVAEEFNANNNTKFVYVEGIIIGWSIQDLSFYSIIYVFAFFAVLITIFYGLLKMLMSERPPLLKYWRRIQGYFAKKFLN